MSDLDLAPARDRTLRAHAVEELRLAIVSGRLTPGAKLTELELAQQLGVSRGPLREAIRALIGQGLLRTVPYTGVFVADVTPKNLREIYSFRTELEQFAFRLLWPIRDDSFATQLARRHDKLRAAVGRDDGATAIARELELHSLPYEFAGHDLLLESWENLRSRLQFYFSLHQRAHGRHGPRRDAHEIYVKLALGHDLEAMLDHITEHMQQGLSRVIDFVVEMQAEGWNPRAGLSRNGDGTDGRGMV